jgi:radical SAM superfamily enzyme YgiQ (UPF0313 family)
MKTALIFPRLLKQTKSFLPPVGITTVATALKREGFDVELIDCSFDADISRAACALRSLRPTVTGIYISVDMMPQAADLIALAKELGSVTVAGGPQPTFFPEEVFAEIPSLDAIVLRDAEGVICDAISAAAEGDLSSVPGVVFRKDDELVRTPPREPVGHLDLVPIPDRTLLSTYDLYRCSGFTGLILSSGCPYECKFCQPALKIMSGGYRAKSAQNAVEEIDFLHRQDRNRYFLIDDDMFVIDRDWIRRIIAGLRERRLLGKLRFVALSRVDLFDRELAELLKELGVYFILFGIESGSQEILDSFNKRTTVEEARRAFALARQMGFRTHGFVILGSPGETRETLRKTEEFIYEVKPDSVFISLFAPVPGSYFYEELRAVGKLNVKSSEHMSYYSWKDRELTVKNEQLTYDEVVAARSRILGKRRFRFLASNALEALKSLCVNPSLRSLWLRAKFYGSQSHYHG